MARFGWASSDGAVHVAAVPGRGTTSSHPCASCGRCCQSFIVPLCGADVWRISRRLHLHPRQFVVAWRESERGDDTFQLEPDGPLHSLVLDKRGWARGGTACVFLLRLGDGQLRCGVYDHRPAACGVYPMLPGVGGPTVRADALCPPDAWPDGEGRQPAWSGAMRAASMGFDVYHAVVEHWNRRVRRLGAICPVDDYYDYLLRAYDRIDAQVDAASDRELRSAWRTAPDGVLPAPWQRHLEAVRELLAAL